MEVGNIASLATSMAQQRTDMEVSVTVLKKALDLQGASALALIESAGKTSPAALPAHLGNNINTRA